MAVDQSKVGRDLKTQVGTVMGMQARYIAHVQECKGEKCPLYDQCTYKKKMGPCKVIHNFLSSLYRDWVDPDNGIGDIIVQSQLDRLGLLVIPLYHMYIRMLLETFSVDSTDYEDSKGRIHTRPQFIEMPKLIREIRAELKDIGLDKLWNQKFGRKKPLPAGKSMDDLMRDGQGYEAAQGWDENS